MTPDDERDLFLATLWFVVTVAFCMLLTAAALSGCGGNPTPEVKYVEKVVTVPTTIRCAKVPPPVLSPISGAIVCATNMVCLTTLDAATVVDNVERLKSWVAETWALCAPETK